MGNFHDVLGHQQGRRLLKSLRGFSLIELIVGMAILGILTSLAIPAFSEWLRNARVRTTTESVQNGLQLARAEAVRRNSVMRFSLVTTTDASCALATAGPNWVVSIDDPAGQCDVAPSDTVAPRIVQLRSAAEGGAATTVAAGASAFIFNSLGRPTLPLPAAGNVAIIARLLGAIDTLGSLAANPSHRQALDQQVQWLAELTHRTVPAAPSPPRRIGRGSSAGWRLSARP